MPFLLCMHGFKKKKERKKKQFADLTKSLDVETQRLQGQNAHCVLIIGFQLGFQLSWFEGSTVPVLDKLIYNVHFIRNACTLGRSHSYPISQSYAAHIKHWNEGKYMILVSFIGVWLLG